MNRTIFIVIALTASAFIYAPVIHTNAGPAHTGRAHNGHEVRLSKNLKRLLSAEMNGIQKGMTVLAIAIPAANWDGIAGTAENMKESYIMKKKLSKKEREELHHSFPTGFHTLDREFHDTAGLLRQAAKEHNRELVNTYFCKLSETCVKCHSLYAVKRFPGFK